MYWVELFKKETSLEVVHEFVGSKHKVEKQGDENSVDGSLVLK